jgi:transposase
MAQAVEAANDEELSHRRGRRPKGGVVLVNESKSGKHKCRRITKWKDNRDEGTITFLANDFETPASILCEVYRRRWQIETLFKRLKQNFPLKYFLGDNQNAIQIQIWVSMIAWLLMQVIKKQVKRKWSLSNMMTAVHILLNSYMGLYDFLNLPEGRWIKIIEARQKKDDENHQPRLFPEMSLIVKIKRPRLIYSKLQMGNRIFPSDSNRFFTFFYLFCDLIIIFVK